MGQRKLERPRPTAGQRRQARQRPRYARISAAGLSLLVTLVALLGGLGVLPADSPAAAEGREPTSATAAALWVQAPEEAPAVVPSPAPVAGLPTARARSTSSLPSRSGEGKRVVFDISAQRVWLVARSGAVQRTYLVSGSVLDNLRPGTYEVYSRSRYAVGINSSGQMEHFVRFTRGANAAIGFHSIPTKDGRPLQSRSDLGTPQSHGCIRQAPADAKKLWDFAPLGTTVVVTA